jgi:hypothetical protein
VVINQGGHRVTENSKAAYANASATELAGFDPAIDRPPADVQQPGRFIDPQQSFALQCQNVIHDKSLHAHPMY